MTRTSALCLALLAAFGCGGDADRGAELEAANMDLNVQLEVLRQERDEAREALGRARQAPRAGAAGAAFIPPADSATTEAGVAMPGPAISITSATAGVTQADNVSWRFAWRAEISNLTAQPQEYTGRTNFLDANNLTVGYDFISRATVAPNDVRTLDGSLPIPLPEASRVTHAEVVIETSAGPVRYELPAAGQAPATGPAYQAQQAQAERPAPPPSRRTERREPEPKPAELRSYSPPRVDIAAGAATIHGTLYNGGDVEFRGRVTVTLIVDGIDDTSYQVDVFVPAHGSSPYTAIMRGVRTAQQRYDARVSW